jgi:DnaJ-domain-containing protein 1
MADDRGSGARRDREDETRRQIARLAVAVMGADRPIGPTELAALEGLGVEEMPAIRQLDCLGLGPLAEVAWEEARRAVRTPVDVDAVCAALRVTGPRAASTILAALAEVAASDGAMSPAEVETLVRIAAGLGVPVAEARRMVAAAAAGEPPASAREIAAAVLRPPPPRQPAEVAEARAVLGVGPRAQRSEVEAAYRRLIERYSPARVVELGGDFAAVAVRTLARITDAYETVIDALAPR